jgi:alginate O-acetyltransferase complex protein AlgI
VFLILSTTLKPLREKVMSVTKLPALPRRILQSFTTTTLFVFAIVFFRADSFNKVYTIFRQIFTLGHGARRALGFWLIYQKHELMAIASMVIMLFVIQIIQELEDNVGLDFIYKYFPRPLRWVVYFVLLFAIVIYGVDGSVAFVYFQF